MDKNCVMCDIKLNDEDWPTSVYSCEKCYNKYPFWTISEKKLQQVNKINQR